jgi:hypothetical protein
MARLHKRWDETANVCYQLAAAMQSANCDTELLYHPGDEDPSGVILRYPLRQKTFVCLVSQPQIPKQVRHLISGEPLPFPED